MKPTSSYQPVEPCKSLPNSWASCSGNGVVPLGFSGKVQGDLGKSVGKAASWHLHFGNHLERPKETYAMIETHKMTHFIPFLDTNLGFRANSVEPTAPPPVLVAPCWVPAGGSRPAPGSSSPTARPRGAAWAAPAAPAARWVGPARPGRSRVAGAAQRCPPWKSLRISWESWKFLSIYNSTQKRLKKMEDV